MKKQIEQKQNEYDFWVAENIRLSEAGIDVYDDKRIYARNRIKWLYREIKSLKYKMEKNNV